MEALFLKLFNMSITASWLVLAVVILRLLLKKAPKAVTVFLWALVGIRLVCPFSFESVLSVIPSAEPIPQAVLTGPDFNIDTGLSPVDSRVNDYLNDRYFEGVTVPAGNGMTVMGFISVIWLVGIAVILIYTLISYLKIHRKVREAVPYNENIWVCDRIAAPFILGVFHPKIYLLSDIDKQDEEYVIAHERAHLKRRDHLIKPLGFLLLTVYWFNPVMWIAYILLCRDIELACDEKVIKTMGIEIKKPYSEALINCSLPRRAIAACPLAFGEVGVKSRIKSVLNYKKPAFWVIIAAIFACIVVVVCFLTNPKGQSLRNIEGLDLTGWQENTVHLLKYDGEDFYGILSVNEELLYDILEIRISKKEISESRSEERDKTNTLILKENDDLFIGIQGLHICFNKDFTEVWVNDGVKPTLSYKVLSPEKAKKIYNDICNYVDDDEKTTTSELNNSLSSFSITDRTETEQIPCAQAFEEFYRDGKFIYEFSCVKSEYVEVHYSDGTKENIKEALKSRNILITDLDDFNIEYSKKNIEKTGVQESERNYNPYFNATMLRVYDNSVLVEPFEGSNELKSADKINVNTNVISTHPVPELKEGMQIRIVYNGTIEETYPANIPTAFAIYELREVDGKLEPVIATPPKSEAATSLIDSDIKEIYVLTKSSKGQKDKFTVSKTYTDNKLKQLKAFLTTEYCEEKEADNWVKFNPAHPNQTKLALVLSDGTTMIINIHFTEGSPYYIAIGTVEESFDTEKDYSDIEYTRYIAKAVFGEFLKSII